MQLSIQCLQHITHLQCHQNQQLPTIYIDEIQIYGQRKIRRRRRKKDKSIAVSNTVALGQILSQVFLCALCFLDGIKVVKLFYIQYIVLCCTVLGGSVNTYRINAASAPFIFTKQLRRVNQIHGTAATNKIHYNPSLHCTALHCTALHCTIADTNKKTTHTPALQVASAVLPPSPIAPRCSFSPVAGLSSGHGEL